MKLVRLLCLVAVLMAIAGAGLQLQKLFHSTPESTVNCYSGQPTASQLTDCVNNNPVTADR